MTQVVEDLGYPLSYLADNTFLQLLQFVPIHLNPYCLIAPINTVMTPPPVNRHTPPGYVDVGSHTRHARGTQKSNYALDSVF